MPSAPGMPQPPSPDHAPHIGPEGTPLNPGHRDESRGQRVVHEAAEQFGHPYMYGGDGPVAFDCSGLTKYVYAHVGVQLPHNAADQYGVVNHVAQSDKQLGDLIFIYDNQGIFHVGIYAGDGQMWAASHTGDVVRKQPIWTDSYVVGRP